MILSGLKATYLLEFKDRFFKDRQFIKIYNINNILILLIETFELRSGFQPIFKSTFLR